MTAIEPRNAATALMANLESEPHALNIKPLQRSDSCNSCISDGLLSPVVQRSVHLTGDTLNKLTDAAKRQLKWDRAMCAELDLPEGYANVHVMLIRWVKNDWELETGKEINELRDIFERSFGYDVEVLDLQGTCSCSTVLGCHCSPQDRLDRDVVRFFSKHSGPDKLIILYYTGHASYNESNQHLELHGYLLLLVQGIVHADCDSVEQEDGKPEPAKAIWNHTEAKFIRKAECDILAIMDACFAGGISATVEADYGRSYEYLGASEWNRTTPSPGDKSFSRALINSLKALVAQRKGKSFTTSELQTMIEQQKYRKDKPGVLRFRSMENDRRILLKPKKPIDGEVDRYFDESKIEAYLNLRIELKDLQINDVDMVDLAKRVSKAVKKSAVRTRRVDLLSLQRRERLGWKEAATRALALRRYAFAMSSTSSFDTMDHAQQVEGQELQKLPIQRPGVYAILGWISPNFHPHKVIIPIPRPWPGVIIVALAALAVAGRSSISFPNLKSVVASLIRRLSNRD